MDNASGLPASESSSVMKSKPKPTKEVRIGSIKAAIWKNDTENGVRFNVTFSRLYRDGESWQSTDSFGRDDLLLLGKVADQAHSWICSANHEGETTQRNTGSTREEER